MFNLSGISPRSILSFIVLLIVIGAGAYYYYVYLPENESQPVKSAQVTAKPAINVKKPQDVVKSPVVQAPPSVSAVPAAPVAASVPGTAPMQTASASPQSPVPALNPETVKSEPAEPKPVTKKPKVKSRPAKSAKTRKPPKVPEKRQEIAQPVPVVLTEPVMVTVVPTIISPKYNDMLTAALRGDQDGVKQLLEMGHWVDKPGPSGTTPLMASVMNRDKGMVKLLLDNGAEPTVQAIKLARKNKDAEIVLLLEQHRDQ